MKSFEEWLKDPLEIIEDDKEDGNHESVQEAHEGSKQVDTPGRIVITKDELDWLENGTRAGPVTCGWCNGTGVYTYIQKSEFGDMEIREQCQHCNGTGSK